MKIYIDIKLLRVYTNYNGASRKKAKEKNMKLRKAYRIASIIMLILSLCTFCACEDNGGGVPEEGFTMKATVRAVREKIEVDVTEAEYASGIYEIIISDITVITDAEGNEVKRSAIEGYNEVYDLRLIDALEKELDAIKKSESGSFELEITQSVSNGILGSKLTTETDKVNYTITDGKINYTCDADMDGDKYTISYKDGERTVVYYEDGGVETTHTDKPTNEKQIEFVTNLLIMHYFEKNYIENIEKVEGKDEYIVTLYPHAEFLAAFGLDSGFKLYTRDYTLTFTMNDGKISELKVDTMSDKDIKVSYKFFSY